MIDLDKLERDAEAEMMTTSSAFVCHRVPALIAELRALREALRVGFTCPECGKELDDVVVAHRHSAGNCTESLIGPDVRQYLDAMRKGGG